VSWREISKDEFAKIIPVKPPNENIKINPNDHNILISKFKIEFLIVASHLKILIPVGIAITIVAAVK